MASQGMIGDLLRARRRRLSRDEVGLPPIGDQVSGLRREEVAYLAGMSVTWYTWLEQGRAIRPSRQVLKALAETLRLSQAEWVYLLSLAGYSEPDSAAGPVFRRVPAHVQRFLDSLLDLPSYVLAPDWRVLAWNAAYAGLYPGIVSVPESDRNLLWLLFTDPYLRELLPDWEGCVRAHVAAFRAQAGLLLSDRRFSGVVKRLLAVSESFRAVWESHSVEGLSSRERVFRHPVAGDLQLEQHIMTPSDSPGLKVVILTPTPNTGTCIRLLRSTARRVDPADMRRHGERAIAIHSRRPGF